MDKSWINILNRLDPLYENGAKEFLHFASLDRPNSSEILCPCRKCRNRKFVPKDLIVEHIVVDGFLTSYTSWIFHGEKSSQVTGPDTHGIVRTLGKRPAPSLVFGPVNKRSQAEQRDFDARVEIEVQKATSAIRIDMEKRLAEAKKDMEAKLDEKVLDEKVKARIQAYLQSMGFRNGSNSKTISTEQLSDNSNEDRQQSLSPVSNVQTNKHF
ncbi:uncharacterized protein LOC132062483 isoform X2 [Lycium ferocissimum]|uniref:uncharacterized protein LOC132062483 isoform X2 n=1 Tax=Lycium ferocissimum TaxID=112874 RepID=UPI0028161088|nr:uncharacterized protein LOC132062483 isoform X2 [Lycium ferocissimum]